MNSLFTLRERKANVRKKEYKDTRIKVGNWL